MGKKDSSIFRFKQFECSHSRSSMKIGVDAVLLGAWSSECSGNILDVGTGCGVIALMCAQKNPGAQIFALDVDAGSLSEAFDNFSHSLWADRLLPIIEDFNTPLLSKLPQFQSITPSFDLIVSNPPYFDSGVNHTDSARLRARHDSALPHSVLLKNAKTMLSEKGRIELILPYDRMAQLNAIIEKVGLTTVRLVKIKGHPEATVKRVLVSLAHRSDRDSDAPMIEDHTLILYSSPGNPSQEYQQLCHPFYLHF